ncbi:MAG: type II toxin-antitoxin system RelB/DinJ family antitoxin [Galactobacillus timonensis]|uniref:type II toxin-antitoxin system RelB/DinJ family antitoxin n=1 Tax=Galactobacillus timonensis TaxID=2041840 RepID=UPI000C855F95|nr:type II toxin-antitoxin system RelB/DinJ family antitoxin [Galactobacillus timonensis]MDD5851310.1 type II toxin-antitoxin system RelB/DinJ family antitoxin [Galactobacillus timonensis]MDD6370123.1 type II toxin-antitoxin system RelB/DinJ family antitoxin [Galactobacillus timonensis]MDD6598935.1 type II toxin-antitoxin system RelB/DinJ family antitoxin [Galactobacillus timonensis]MDD6681251.1 type II toxin-antitoxin system RelB/DinJ family antitoxin [Galactobacillus timonensis]
MSKTANINVRIDPEFKTEVEDLYSSFGMSVTEAINIFLHMSVMEGGLPFEVRQPRFNAETESAMKEARAIANGTISAKKYSSAKEMINDILAED